MAKAKAAPRSSRPRTGHASTRRPAARARALVDARRARAIFDQLDRQHPGATTELHYRNAFELLVATILSAQCTDARVNQVTPALFARYPDAGALARATPEALEPQIQATGFFRMKSRSLVGMSAALVERHRGRVPASMDALVALPGVGRKTANVVLGHALGVPGLPVDRHVLRVANRIGLVRSDDPEVVEAALGSVLPPERWTPRLRRPDPARTARLPADSALRPLHGPGRLRLLPRARDQGCSTSKAPPPAMTRARFLALVDDALASIPRAFRDALENIAIVVEDDPTPEELEAVGVEPPDTLLGLYQGVPLPERSWSHGNTLPDKVTLFQRPIEAASDREDDVVAAIGETLIHELGHYFGLSEEEIEAIEEQYWRGGGDTDVR